MKKEVKQKATTPKKETHRVSLDIPKEVWINARQEAIKSEDTPTPKEVLEKVLVENYENKKRR